MMSNTTVDATGKPFAAMSSTQSQYTSKNMLSNTTVDATGKPFAALDSTQSQYLTTNLMSFPAKFDTTSKVVTASNYTQQYVTSQHISDSIYYMDDTSSPLNATSYYSDDYDFDYGDEYMYPGYDFERGLYLYIWEIVVVIIFLVNLVVISVLLRRKMRNSTNIILAAIAISDSLTGLVTLPTYIMVFQRFDPLTDNGHYSDYYSYNFTDTQPSYADVSGDPSGNSSLSSIDYPAYADGTSQEAVDGYILSKSLCNGFMISKYFLSKTFHTVSIFLTLFLGIQRYVSVAYPYKSQFLFNSKRTLICCVVIFVLAPLLHSYHLSSNKAENGLCQWELQEEGCGDVCIYLWIAFFVRHFLPCVTLVAFSLLFIFQLRLGEESLRRMDSNRSQISRRVDENRRISIVVTAIVIVFLIPEIPFGIFLLYNAIDKAANEGKGIDLKTNRAIQMAYEICLVLSFHANFYIYTFFNRRFRKVLYRTIVKPVRRFVGDRRLSITRTSSTSHHGSSRKTTMTNSKTIDSKIMLDTNLINRNDLEKTAVLEMKPLKTFVAAERKHAPELEPLNAK